MCYHQVVFYRPEVFMRHFYWASYRKRGHTFIIQIEFSFFSLSRTGGEFRYPQPLAIVNYCHLVHCEDISSASRACAACVGWPIHTRTLSDLCGMLDIRKKNHGHDSERELIFLHQTLRGVSNLDRISHIFLCCSHTYLTKIYKFP